MKFGTLCMALLAVGVQAQEQDQDLSLAYGDAATVSIATGQPQSLRRAPAVALAITAEQIRAMGATDLEDLLSRVPGLHLSRHAAFYSPAWVMRGIYSQYNQQILVLWNGQPLTTAQRGDRASSGWRGLPVAHLARVEILRGPGSALYGAEAFAGVINLVTKSGAEIDGLELGLHFERFATREAALQWGGRHQGGEHALWLRSSRSDGFSARVEADAQTVNDAAFGAAASLAPGPLNLARRLDQAGLDLSQGRWRLRAQAEQREFESGAGIAFALDPRSLERTRRLNAELAWSAPRWTEQLELGLNLDFQAFQQLFPRPLMIFPPGARFPTGLFADGMFGAPETWERRWRLNATLVWSGWRGHQWRIGAGLENLDMYRTAESRNFSYAPSGLPIPLPEFSDFSQSAPFLRPHRRDHQHLYLQDEWQLAPDWQLTAGLRHDRYSDVGKTSNPRLALVWDARHDLTLKLLHGRAYRAPAFAELHAISNPVARGNPALRPETLRSSELVALWQGSRSLQASLSLFRLRVADLIRPTPNSTPGTGSTFNNSGGQSGRGGEAELRWQGLPDLGLQASYSWQRGRDAASGASTGYAPDWRALLGLEWRGGAWQGQLQLVQVGTRQRPPGDARPALRGYLSADLALRWALPGQPWSLALQLRNLGDADIREPSLAPGRSLPQDLPQAPRSLGLEATWRL